LPPPVGLKGAYGRVLDLRGPELQPHRAVEESGGVPVEEISQNGKGVRAMRSGGHA